MSTKETKDIVKNIVDNKVKALVWDIETSPNLILDFSCGYNKSITHGQILEERKIVGICYKYLGKDKVHHLRWKTKGKGVDAERCDKSLVRKFSKVLMDCDVAIAHNGDGFDYKWLKGRAMFHRLPPVTGVQTIDTYKLSRANFNLNSQKLDYLSQFLFRKHKLTTNFSLWKKVWLNDKKALNYMMEYCEMDVRLLEDAYNEILPYCEKLPMSMGVLNGGTREDCPSCASTEFIKYGTHVSKIGRYQKFKCNNCAHVFRDTRMLKETKE